MLARKKTDWDAIRRDYGTGKYTLRELEAKHGVFNSSIARKAKNNGWTQDLAGAIRQATNTKLANQIVGDIASKCAQDVSSVIAQAADFNAAVISSHRVRLTDLASSVDQAKASVLLLGSKVNGIREASLFMQAVCNLANATRTLIDLERKSYNLDAEAERSNPQDAFATLLDGISARGSRLPIELGNDACGPSG